MAKEKGRQPDYDLSALDKRTEKRGQVGAAWINDDGSLSIKLHMSVVLDARDDLVITLFPRGPRARGPKESPDDPLPY